MRRRVGRGGVLVGVPVAFTTPESAAEQIEAWATYHFREKAKPFVTPSELGDLTWSLAMP